MVLLERGGGDRWCVALMSKGEMHKGKDKRDRQTKRERVLRVDL